METNRLKQFRVVVETGNLRKAAELLHMTHGALSKSIKVLEGELGVRLFVPDGRGIRITERGREIYAQSEEILSGVERLLGRKRTAAERMPSLRIATFEIFSTYFLASLLKHLEAEVHLTLHELAPGLLEGALIEGRADVGITYLPIPTSGIDFIKIASVSMGIFSSREGLRKHSVEELPFVVPIPHVSGSPLGVKSVDGWPDHFFTRKVQYEVDLMESALQLCRNGYAAVYLPRFVARLHNEIVGKEYALVERPWPGQKTPLTLDVYLETRHGYLEDAFIRKIAKAIRLTVR